MLEGGVGPTFSRWRWGRLENKGLAIGGRYLSPTGSPEAPIINDLSLNMPYTTSFVACVRPSVISS
jgi:hypothetical protein